MTITEMHTEVKLATQNIATETRRKLLPEEIDWLLNKNQYRFIHSKLTPGKSGGFQSYQLKDDSIASLITSYSSPAYIQEDRYEVPLPPDYDTLLRSSSKVLSSCEKEAKPATTETQVNGLNIPFSEKNSPKYYGDFVINAGDKAIPMTEIARNAFSGYQGLSSKQEKYLLKDIYHWYLNRVKGIPVWKDHYQGINADLIFPDTDNVFATSDGEAIYSIKIPVGRSCYPEAGSWKPNRKPKTEILEELLETPFWTSTEHSPATELRGGSLVVYGSTSFTISTVRIIYIRKPLRMSLSLGLDCELPSSSHQAICDLTTEYFKAITADPGWKVKMEDNITRSPMTL